MRYNPIVWFHPEQKIEYWLIGNFEPFAWRWENGNWIYFPLMQFTGKKDVKWKEIYESDIVSWNFTYAWNCIVIWDEKRCWFYLKPITWFSASDKYLKMNACKLEIIWNSFENPDLLN